MEYIKPDIPSWVLEEKIFYTPKYFSNLNQIKDEEDRNLQILGLAKSKFLNMNVLDSNRYESFEDETEDFLVSISCFGDTTVVFPDLGQTLNMSSLDLLTLDSSISYAIQGDFHKQKLKCSKDKKVFGEGSSKFEVVATIRDEYRISVMADSPAEAIELARDIDICEWLHPDIEPHLEDRRLVRFARWGNFYTTEVKDVH